LPPSSHPLLDCNPTTPNIFLFSHDNTPSTSSSSQQQTHPSLPLVVVVLSSLRSSRCHRQLPLLAPPCSARGLLFFFLTIVCGNSIPIWPHPNRSIVSVWVLNPQPIATEPDPTYNSSAYQFTL